MTVDDPSSPLATVAKPNVVQRTMQAAIADSRTNTAALLGTTFEPIGYYARNPAGRHEIREFRAERRPSTPTPALSARYRSHRGSDRPVSQAAPMAPPAAAASRLAAAPRNRRIA